MKDVIEKVEPSVIQDVRGADWDKGIRIDERYTVMRNDTVYGVYDNMSEAKARADEVSLSKGVVMTKEEGFVRGISTASSVPVKRKRRKKR